MLIRTKEDFKGKYIKLPIDISHRKFKKIKSKFNRLGFDHYYLDYKDVKFGKIYVRFSALGAWQILNGINKRGTSSEISIEDFLRTNEYNQSSFSIFNTKTISYFDYTSLDFGSEPKTFKNAFEALAWCIKNPGKIIQYRLNKKLFFDKFDRNWGKFVYTEKVGIGVWENENNSPSQLLNWSEIKEYVAPVKLTCPHDHACMRRCCGGGRKC